MAADASIVFPPAASSMWQPERFLFGAATASYQIEGATQVDGRLPCIWDTYSATPGRTHNGDSGEFACDHYHRWESDLDLLAGFGFGAYRLSIAWPRVLTESGAVNPKGLDFYKRLLDRLKELGIRAYATLYHWDLPQHLQDRGGWLNRDTAQRFADYASCMGRELNGRVDAWMTLNEPWCSAYLGHSDGRHAPGFSNVRYGVEAMHHLLLGHGLALSALRSHGNTPVGIVANVNYVTPASESEADRRAARLAYACHNTWVLDPLFEGRYPAELQEAWPGSQAPMRDGDMKLISTPLDFLGINYYFRSNVAAGGDHGWVDQPLADVERTQMSWEVHPDGLRQLLVDFHRRYPKLPPIYITENGMASDDAVTEGQVHDEQRMRFLGRHFAAVDAAMREGVDVRGYFVWSLMDNFEWSFGYEKRFGIVHIDYGTQARTPKDSAFALKEFFNQRRSASA